MCKKLTPAERLDLLIQPYLRPCEVAALIGKPDSTTCEACKRKSLKKHERLGYYTQDIIKAFGLEPSIQLWMQLAKG